MKITAIDNTPALEDVFVQGKPLDDQTQKYIYSADLEMSTTEVSELAISLDDPDFDVLKKGTFDINTPVTYRGAHLYVAVVETNDGGGLGGLTIRCRPLAVRKLKDFKTTDKNKGVYKDLTPGDYVIAECKRAGVAKTPFVQKGKKKHKIVRDKEEAGVTYDPASEPSAWTTMQRLAAEEGYILYEVGGVIYFGQPTWLVKHLPTLEVVWYSADGKEPASIPQFRQTVDSKDTEITVELPIARAGHVFPGCNFTITDFPRFKGPFYVTGVSYPLVGLGRGNINVTAATTRNPEKQSALMDYAGEWVPNADKRGNNCKFTPREMVERAYKWIGKDAYARHCQTFIDVLGKGHPGGAATAFDTWAQRPDDTPHGPEVNAPAGAVVVWDRGVGDGAGHIAMSVGNGKMITTTGGAIKKCAIKDGYISGTSHYVGWMYPDLVGPP